MPKVGLRERKKAATRSLIAKTAERLFAKHGFDGVTIERVADECVVSAKTVLRYFPTKETLALARLLDLLEGFKEGLAYRDTDVVGYWRAHVKGSAREEVGNESVLRRYMDMIHSYPGLEAHFVAITRQYEDVLTEALAEESGDDGLGPGLLAAMLVSGNSAVGYYKYKTGEPFDPEMYVVVADFIAETFPKNVR